MLPLAASRRLLHLRPGMELYLRSCAHSPLSSWYFPTLIPMPRAQSHRSLSPKFTISKYFFCSRAKGVARFRQDPPRRKLVSFRQGAFEEKDTAMDKAVPSTDEQLGHCKDDNAAHPMENNFANEFMQLSLEEEGSGELCGISERVVRDVQKSAIELLAARAFTVSELTKKLRSKNYPVDVVDTVVAEFKSRGLLNDGFYAESFSRSRWLSSTWGPRRIKQALRQKGVPEAEVDQATRAVFQDGHANQTTYGISEASMDHLFAQASKQWQRGQSLTLENRHARVVRWLQYRGFNRAVTNAILRKLEAKHPP